MRLFAVFVLAVAVSGEDALPDCDPVGWDGFDLDASHYWDCSGQGCDSLTVKPWDVTKFVSHAGYAPLDPNDFGGPSQYGEKMWLTGAASDMLSSLMGADDGCCGADDEGRGACGKCLLLENPDATNKDWRAILMKKNRCPPESKGCDGAPHLDILVPGYDVLQFSTANVCGIHPNTGFENQEDSAILGRWFDDHPNTVEAGEAKCDSLPEEFRKGCKLFSSWGWIYGKPERMKYKAVPCPDNFKAHVGIQYGANGPLNNVLTSFTPVPTVEPTPPCIYPTPAPTAGPRCCYANVCDAGREGCNTEREWCSGSEQNCGECGGNILCGPEAMSAGATPVPTPAPASPTPGQAETKCCYSECGVDWNGCNPASDWCSETEANCAACSGTGLCQEPGAASEATTVTTITTITTTPVTTITTITTVTTTEALATPTPTDAPPTPTDTAPTPTEAPATPTPTDAPTPTEAPATPTPTDAPTPTEAPATPTPTDAPTPTEAPATPTPTEAPPATPSPTDFSPTPTTPPPLADVADSNSAICTTLRAGVTLGSLIAAGLYCWS